MKIEFCKMQGAGNDYIYIDIRDVKEVDLGLLIPKMCDRHYGIGGDGVVLVDYPTKRMIMYNADGSRGAICGNALRCVGHLLYLTTGESEHIVQTDVGQRRVVKVDGGYKAEMGESKIVDELTIDGEPVYLVDVGNQHAVSFGHLTPKELAERLRKAYTHFADKVNVEVVRDNLAEVYERGTGYTLSCGSGAVAVATVKWERGEQDDRLLVPMKGGALTVSREGDKKYLEGDAVVVYRGQYDVE